ncbi:hypothetical protein L6R52_12395 [Myxococcota bacterium]|nr:hypothetical protein [Myxococcota bacterium]
MAIVSLSRSSTALCALLSLSACGPEPVDVDVDGALYTLMSAVDGVSFAPPLGPELTPTGPFDATLLPQLQIVLEATDADAEVWSTLATFDHTTTTPVRLLAAHEVFAVNVRAASFFTDPSLSYRFRALLSGREVARSDLSSMVFVAMQHVPNLMVGVKVRLEARPAPVITTLSPAATPSGSEALTLTLDGVGFVRDSVARADGQELATTYVSPNRLTASVPAELVANVGDRAITIFTAAPGGGTSASMNLAVEAPALPTNGSGWSYDEDVPQWAVSGRNAERATFLLGPDDLLTGWGRWYLIMGAHHVEADTGVHYYELETDIFTPNDTTYGPWVMVGAVSKFFPNPRSVDTYWTQDGYGLYWSADGAGAQGTWFTGWSAPASSTEILSNTILSAPGVAGVRLDTDTDTMTFYLDDTVIWTTTFLAVDYPVVPALTMYGTIGSATLLSSPIDQHYPERGSGNGW